MPKGQKIGMSRERENAEKTSVSIGSDDIRKTSLGRQSCQQEALSRFRDVRSKPEQDFQEIMQSTALTTRQSGFVPIGSPFSFQASPLFKTSVTRLTRALLVYNYNYNIYICYIFISSYIVYPISYIVYYMLYLILYIPYGIHICLFIFI